MSWSLYPDKVFRDYTCVTAELLLSHGVVLLLCDLDYTLAPKSQALPDADVLAWITSLQAAGIKVIVLSNNRSPKRVMTFCHELGIEYIGHAKKPSARTFRAVMAAEKVTPQQTAMLGDKLLTDVLGANNSGILSLMVEPKGGPVGLWNHVLHFLQKPFKWGRRDKL